MATGHPVGYVQLVRKALLMMEISMWELLRMFQLMIQWVSENRTHPYVDSSSALCATGLLHLPPYSYIFIALGKIVSYFCAAGVNEK